MTICEIVKKVKEDKENFYLILEKFNPLLKKYIRLLYQDDKEDVYSELTVALWEAVCKISYYENEGQVINYLSMALKNKFFELYRASCKYHNYITELENTEILMISEPRNVYEEIILQEDLQKISNNLKGKKKQIVEMIFVKGYSNVEVAEALNVSRQYVHKVKKELCDSLKKEYFGECT